MKNKKIVFVDSGSYMFKAIFASKYNPGVPVTWSYMNMIIADLRRLFLTEDDILILAVDSPEGSWRRDYDRAYKANRKENRDKHTDIDWEYMFQKFNSFIKILGGCTPFHTICIPRLEADDIIAYGCEYYKDAKEVIILSIDSDFEMLAVHPHVKLYSPNKKSFKEIKNPYKILEKKIESEKADNLVSPILNEKDYEIRNTIVNLINLPVFIKTAVENVFNCLNYNKEWNLNLIPFDSIADKFKLIYSSPVEIKVKKKRKKKLKQTMLLTEEEVNEVIRI